MKRLIILMLIPLLFTACASTKDQPHTNAGIMPVADGGKLGWSKNDGNLIFNSGPLKRDFPNSPVGKAWYYFFDKDDQKDDIEHDDDSDAFLNVTESALIEWDKIMKEER